MNSLFELRTGSVVSFHELREEYFRILNLELVEIDGLEFPKGEVLKKFVSTFQLDRMVESFIDGLVDCGDVTPHGNKGTHWKVDNGKTFPWTRK